MNRQFPKEEIQKTNKYVQQSTCSSINMFEKGQPAGIKEMPIKTVLRFSLTSTSTKKIKPTVAGEAVGTEGQALHAAGDKVWHSHDNDQHRDSP